MCVVWAGWLSRYSDWLRAGRSGIESRWRRDFPPVQISPGAHPVSCKIGTGSFPGVKCGRGVLLTTHPLLVPRSWKNRAIPLPTLWATPDLKRDHFTFIYIYIYIYIYSAVSTGTRLSAERSSSKMPAEARCVYLLQNVKTASGS